MLIGQLVWEKTDLIRGLKHLEAMLGYAAMLGMVQEMVNLRRRGNSTASTALLVLPK